MKIAQLQKLKIDICEAITNDMPAEYLSELAAEHAEIVKGVNGRLQKANNLIVGGYRDEAFQYAEASPDLMETISILDFQELESWNDLLGENHLYRPASLNLEAAAQIEEAYEDYRRLEPLLKKNRLLALAQAPLQSRILVMKNLVTHDPLNPIWGGDCELLQRARLAQIQQEFVRASSKNDVAKLAQLQEELKQPWDVPIPNNLKARVVETSAKISRSDARYKMQEVAEQLNEALAEFDEAKGRTFRYRWNELNQSANLTAGDDVFVQAREALEWLQELDAGLAEEEGFEQAVSSLEQSVENRVPLQVLDQEIYRAQKFERDIPEALVQRTNHYRDNLLLQGRRKTWIRSVSVLGVLAVVIAGSAWYLIDRANTNAIELARGSMQQFASNNEYNAGRKYHDGLDAVIKSDAEIIRSYDQLVRGEKAETERIDRLAKFHAEFELTGELGPALDDQIENARKLTKSDEEKDQLKILENKLNGERNRRLGERDVATAALLKPLQQELTTLQSGNDLATKAKLETMVDRINDLFVNWSIRVDGRSRLSSSLYNQSQQLVLRTENRIKEITTANRAIIEIGELKKQLNDSDVYAFALGSFSDKFFSNVNAADFQKSAREKWAWSGLKAVQKLAATHANADLTTLTGGSATAVVKDIENLPVSMTGLKASLDQTTAYLKTRENFSVDLDAKRRDLKNAVSDGKLARAAITIIREDGDRLFLVEPIAEGSTRIKYWHQGLKTHGGTIRQSEQAVASAHVKLAARLTAELDRDPTVDSATLVVRMAEIIQADGASDPFVRCVLLQNVFLFGYHTKSVLRDFCGEQLDVMNDGELIDLEWRDAVKLDDLSDGSIPLAAKDFIKKLATEIPNAKTQLKEQQSKLVSMGSWIKNAQSIEVAGFVFESYSGWEVEITAEIADGANAYCLVPDGDKQAKLQLLGTFVGDKIKIASTASPQAGRPVYIVKKDVN